MADRTGKVQMLRVNGCALATEPELSVASPASSRHSRCLRVARVYLILRASNVGKFDDSGYLR